MVNKLLHQSDSPSKCLQEKISCPFSQETPTLYQFHSSYMCQTKACEKMTNIVMVHTISIVFHKVMFGTYISISKENSAILLP
jgi:hypothetical protein